MYDFCRLWPAALHKTSYAADTFTATAPVTTTTTTTAHKVAAALRLIL